jgi:hypothetical protein
VYDPPQWIMSAGVSNAEKTEVDQLPDDVPGVWVKCRLSRSKSGDPVI